MKSSILICIFSLIFLSCKKEDDLDLSNNELSISSFMPLSAVGGDTIRFFGNGFDPVAIRNVIQFNSSKRIAMVLSASKTEMSVVVPTDAQIGAVRIAVGPFSTISDLPFLLSPSITSLNPSAAFPGELVSIRGRNFVPDKTRLVIYVNNILADSILGASSNRVDFYLPAVSPGSAKVRLGILLSERDTVFAAPANFTVFDKERPTITSISPSEVLSGSIVDLRGNAFKTDPDSIFLTINGIQIEGKNLIDLEDDFFTFTIPNEIDVTGLGELAVDVTVSVVNNLGTTLTSDPFTIKILEPSDLPFFYYTALNLPNPSSDDSVYVAETLIGGEALITPLYKFGTAGISLGPDNKVLYYVGGFRVYKGNDVGAAPDDFFPGDGAQLDLSLTSDGNFLFFFGLDRYVSKYDLKNDTFQRYTEISGVTSNNGAYNFKLIKNKTYWAGKANGKKLISVINDVQTSSSLIYEVDDESSNKFVALAGIDNKLYIVENTVGQDLSSRFGASSTIYEGSLDGSTSLKVLYSKADNIGDDITDLEISSDGSTLYWMVRGENGNIRSAPTSKDISKIKIVVPGIKNGNYFDTVEK